MLVSYHSLLLKNWNLTRASAFGFVILQDDDTKVQLKFVHQAEYLQLGLNEALKEDVFCVCVPKPVEVKPK